MKKRGAGKKLTEWQKRNQAEQEEKQHKLDAVTTVDNMYVKLSVEDYGDGYKSNLVAEGEIGFYECRECYALTSSDVAAIRHGEWHFEMNNSLGILESFLRQGDNQ